MNSEDLIYENRIQIIAILGSITLLVFIFRLIQRKKLHENYAIWWVIFGLIFCVLSVWRDALDLFASTIGIAYPPTALFLVFMMAVLLILIQFSLVISRLSEGNKKLSQDIGLLQSEVKKLKDNKNSGRNPNDPSK
jgi:hypothetical protein